MVCMEFGIFIEHNEEFELSDSCNEELGEFQSQEERTVFEVNLSIA